MKTEGYLMIDHRFSPGIPEQTALAMGLDPKLVGAGKVMEGATHTCTHCRGTVLRNPKRVRERYTCQQCGGGFICDGCKAETLAANYTHLNYDERVNKTRELADKGIDITGSSLIIP